MRKPKQPPDFLKLEAKLGSRISELFGKTSTDEPGIDSYLHWDDLIRREPPSGMSHEEWWYVVKLRRTLLSRTVPMFDVGLKRLFTYTSIGAITEKLHRIDLGAGGIIELPDPITNPETRDRYLVQSLFEEAITSSQLEGAATTRQVAKDMLRTGRLPRDKNEQMIYNNYVAMRRIREIKQKPLTRELVLEIHRIITDKTLDEDSAAGRFRSAEEAISVVDRLEGEVYHSPPPAEQLDVRMKMMCEFANGVTPDGFLHPVLRSIILHFWLAYDHPFVDGNGRTARALFYWSMLHHKYWLFEYVSISHILKKAPSKYARSFLLTETDDNDLTYFILYQLQVLEQAIGDLHQYITRKTREVQAVERRLRSSAMLNHRQLALLSHALRHPQHQYTFDSHKTSHDVTYQTARTDLLYLQKKGLLTSRKIGKTWYFTPVPGLEEKLEQVGE